MTAGFGFRFDNSYLRLNAAFYTAQQPTPVPKPETVLFNDRLAAELGLNVEALRLNGAAVFGGNELPAGAEPLAQAYAGHQFGHLTMLGDGRAVLLGEHLTLDERRVDIQLKGSGQTLYSRSGDGRAALGPMLREYLVSECMHALGVPTTRGLAVATTGETVFRERAFPGAVLTRVAASHIRVGTFEFAHHFGTANGKTELVKEIADYTIARHYSELQTNENPYAAFLAAVAERQATLIAKWMSFGFIHGVMNTDNLAVSGETIDFGPCAFMDDFSSDRVFSSIDRRGRYAYRNQPSIAQWNLTRLAECLLPLFDADANRAVEIAKEILGAFPEKFEQRWLSALRNKLGLFTDEADDQALCGTFLQAMQESGADFTISFRELSEGTGPLQPAFAEWRKRWETRLTRQPQDRAEVKKRMLANNPAVIARNHRIEQVIQAAYAGNFAPLHRLNAALGRPFESVPEFSEYREPPRPEDRVLQTFCGT